MKNKSFLLLLSFLLAFSACFPVFSAENGSRAALSVYGNLTLVSGNIYKLEGVFNSNIIEGLHVYVYIYEGTWANPDRLITSAENQTTSIRVTASTYVTLSSGTYYINTVGYADSGIQTDSRIITI